MKKVLNCLFLTMLFASCVNHIEEELQPTSTKVVNFNIGFDIENGPMSRALSDYITGIDVFDYMSDEEKAHISQTSAESGFGSVQLDAAFGTHQLVFVGHNSGSCEYDGEKLSFDKVTDTFTYTTQLTVDNKTGSQDITLARQVGKLTLFVNDAIPENADKMILTVKGYSDELNPETGKGNNSFEYTKEWSIGGHVGATKSNYNLYSFIPNDGYEVDVNIRAVNTDGEDLYNRDVTDVPLRKNQQTTIRGSLFTAGMTASISVSFQWDETITMPL